MPWLVLGISRDVSWLRRRPAFRTRRSAGFTLVELLVVIAIIAVLIGLGATLLAGMAIWCVVNQHGKFTGHWKWVKYGISISMECAR